MEKLLFIVSLLVCFTQTMHAQTSSASQTKVLICNSTTAERYHSSQCSGLGKCAHSISEVQVTEAKSLGRTPCKICYPGASDSSTGGSSSSDYTTKPAPNYGGSGCATIQCSGTTQKGARCRNRTTSCSGRCYHHD